MNRLICLAKCDRIFSAFMDQLLSEKQAKELIKYSIEKERLYKSLEDAAFWCEEEALYVIPLNKVHDFVLEARKLGVLEFMAISHTSGYITFEKMRDVFMKMFHYFHDESKTT